MLAWRWPWNIYTKINYVVNQKISLQANCYIYPWEREEYGHVRFCILFKCYFSWSLGTLEVLTILKKLLSKSIMVPSLMEVNIMYELNDFKRMDYVCSLRYDILSSFIMTLRMDLYYITKELVLFSTSTTFFFIQVWKIKWEK